MKSIFWINVALIVVLLIRNSDAVLYEKPEEIKFKDSVEYISLVCQNDGARIFTFNNLEDLLVGEFGDESPYLDVVFLTNETKNVFHGDQDLADSDCKFRVTSNSNVVVINSNNDVFDKCSYEYTNGSSTDYVGLKYGLRLEFHGEGTFKSQNSRIFQLECQYVNKISDDLLIAEIVPVKDKETQLDEVNLNMDVSLDVFTDDTFENKQTVTSSAYNEYNLEDTIYFQLSAPNANSDLDYNLYTQTCTAELKGTGVQETLVTDGCSVTDLVKVVSAEKIFSRYSLQVFMFKDSVGDIGSDDTIVTVTCTSTICIPINGSVCPAQKTCSKKSKRSANENLQVKEVPFKASTEFQIKSKTKNEKISSVQMESSKIEIYRPKSKTTKASANFWINILFIISNFLLNIASALHILRIIKRKCFNDKSHDKMVLITDEISINLSECSDEEKMI